MDVVPNQSRAEAGVDVEEKEVAPRLMPSQEKVVSFPAEKNGLLLVVAGPGSGKSYTMAKRIGKLIQSGMQSDEILVLSMTNRAVGSLKRHLGEVLSEDKVNSLNIATFHSFCARLIDDHGAMVDPNYQKKLLVDDMSWRNFSDIFVGKQIEVGGARVNGAVSAPKLEKILERVKSGEISTRDASFEYNISENYIIELIKYLDVNGMIRYLDLILEAGKLMEKTKGDADFWIPQLARYKAVFVDEFQDMHYLLLTTVKNIIQYPTYDQELGINKHLSIAGDPNQCIYEFLGADSTLIEKLSDEFPKMDITRLTIKETFRLSPEILKTASDAVLRANDLHIDESLYSTKPNGHKPIVYSLNSTAEEYKFIMDEITRLILELGGLLKPSDFIILTKTNNESDDIKSYFNKFGLNCNIFALTNPWIKSKVRIFVDILNVINQGSGCEFSLLCLIKLLDHDTGSRVRLSKLFTAYESWKKVGRSCDSTFESYINEKDVMEKVFQNPLTRKSIIEFLLTIKSARSELILQSDPTNILEWLLKIVEDTQLQSYMNYPIVTKSNYNEDRDQKLKDHRANLRIYLNQFFEALELSFNRYLKTNGTSFLSHFITTYNENIPIVYPHLINISTIHTAKGLEFPVVFIPGCSTSLWNPGWSTIFSDNVAPMRDSRLYYVAATRASDLLYSGTKQQIGGYPKFVSGNFTEKTPVLSQTMSSGRTLLETLSYNLKREINYTKIQKGTLISLEFKLSYHTLSRVRSIHTVFRKLIRR